MTHRTGSAVGGPTIPGRTRFTFYLAEGLIGGSLLYYGLVPVLAGALAWMSGQQLFLIALILFLGLGIRLATFRVDTDSSGDPAYRAWSETRQWRWTVVAVVVTAGTLTGVSSLVLPPATRFRYADALSLVVLVFGFALFVLAMSRVPDTGDSA